MHHATKFLSGSETDGRPSGWLMVWLQCCVSHDRATFYILTGGRKLAESPHTSCISSIV